MNLSNNTQYWLKRLRAEVSAIPEEDRAIIAMMQVAEVEGALGLEDAARTTLTDCVQRFGALHPGTWTSLVYRASRLCGRLSENRLLEPEVRRGVAWLADPEIARYQGTLRERVHQIAIQTGRADVAADLRSDEWPGKAANELVDACMLAGWAGNASELSRLLPLARAAIAAAAPVPNHLRSTNYGLIHACVRAGLLADAAQLCESGSFPIDATDALVAALWRETDRTTYIRIRNGWIANRVAQFRTEKSNHHFCSSDVRSCAEAIQRLGDADGRSKALQQFREVVATWSPEYDWIACAVNRDVAVLHAGIDDGQVSTEYFDIAVRLYKGEGAELKKTRGSRSLMASILSAGYCDTGNIDVALRFARKVSSVRDRQFHLISALIVGGRKEAAEAELAKLHSPEQRASQIGYWLLQFAERGQA